MKAAYISCLAYEETKYKLKNMGYIFHELGPDNICNSNVSESVRFHPDIYMCKFEHTQGRFLLDEPCVDEGFLHKNLPHAKFSYPRIDVTSPYPQNKIYMGNPDELNPSYPSEAMYNACISGDLFIHNLNITSPHLLNYARDIGLKLINVKQGYTRCNLLPVSTKAFITSDMGIYKVLKAEITDIEVLLIKPDHVLLPGHKYGFLPGSGGICQYSTGEQAVLFNGDLSLHPDFLPIKNFIESNGKKAIWVEGKPLLDIGSIICEELCYKDKTCSDDD